MAKSEYSNILADSRRMSDYGGSIRIIGGQLNLYSPIGKISQGSLWTGFSKVEVSYSSDGANYTLVSTLLPNSARYYYRYQNTGVGRYVKFRFYFSGYSEEHSVIVHFSEVGLQYTIGIKVNESGAYYCASEFFACAGYVSDESLEEINSPIATCGDVDGLTTPKDPTAVVTYFNNNTKSGAMVPLSNDNIRLHQLVTFRSEAYAHGQAMMYNDIDADYTDYSSL